MPVSLVLQNGNFLPRQSTVGCSAQPIITTSSGGFLSSSQSGFCVAMIGTTWQQSESWAQEMFAQMNSIWVSCTNRDTSSKQQALRRQQTGRRNERRWKPWVLCQHDPSGGGGADYPPPALLLVFSFSFFFQAHQYF